MPTDAAKSSHGLNHIASAIETFFSRFSVQRPAVSRDFDRFGRHRASGGVSVEAASGTSNSGLQVKLQGGALMIVADMRTRGPACRVAAHALGERLRTFGRYSFLERQLLIAFCLANYALSFKRL
jgi:hypothetical protein